MSLKWVYLPMSLISQRLVNSRLCRLRCRWGCARYPEVSGYALNHAVIYTLRVQCFARFVTRLDYTLVMLSTLKSD